jgi:hypothetical protein
MITKFARLKFELFTKPSKLDFLRVHQIYITYSISRQILPLVISIGFPNVHLLILNTLTHFLDKELNGESSVARIYDTVYKSLQIYPNVPLSPNLSAQRRIVHFQFYSPTLTIIPFYQVRLKEHLWELPHKGSFL